MTATGPTQLLINGVEIEGAEWDMTFEEVLGGVGRASLNIQDRLGTWAPESHMPVVAKIRSTGWNLYQGELLTPQFTLKPGEPWITWGLSAQDDNAQLPLRKVGAFNGKVWVDPSGFGIYVNIDPYGATLDTDKLTVQALFDHYVRIQGQAVNTTDFVNEYLNELASIEWQYADVKKALEDMAALIQENLQFWIDPDRKFHWVTIPPWYDLLQENVAIAEAPESESGMALMAPEATVGDTDLQFAPYNAVDIAHDPEEGTIGFSNLSFQADGGEMPEQVYVKGSTGYVYNQQPDATSESKVTVHSPTSGDADRYELRFLESTKIWHTDGTGYVSVSYDMASAGGPYEVKWVKVAWNEARNKGGNYWKLLNGPYAGKLVDDNTNTLNGYGEIRVQKVVASSVPGAALVGVGGSGWTNEVTQDPNKRQVYLEAPISDTRSKRDSIGRQALYRGKYPTVRGSVDVYGLDGWRVGQALKITDARLPAKYNNRYYVIQKVASKLLPGNDLRSYRLDFGDGPKSRYSMQKKPGDITWPPPFAYIEISAFDLTPGPNNTQRIKGQLKAPDGTAWRIAGRTVNWSFRCYNSNGVLQSDQGSIPPLVSVTDKYGAAYTKLTTGPGTGLVYYVFADVKAV
jgi:hypothetical protein